MTLKTLLTQITPLPWTRQIDRTQFTRKQIATDMSYAEHAATVLPELVQALEDIYQRRQKCGMPVTVEPWLSIQALLTRAKEIKL